MRNVLFILPLLAEIQLNSLDWQKSIQRTPANFQKKICFVWAAIPVRYQKKCAGAVKLEAAGFFPTFVELYGRDEANWEITMAALARYTQYASSEMAVKWFIINHEERMMEQMYTWSKDENECVRRLASKGCRQRLSPAAHVQHGAGKPLPSLLCPLKNGVEYPLPGASSVVYQQPIGEL